MAVFCRWNIVPIDILLQTLFSKYIIHVSTIYVHFKNTTIIYANILCETILTQCWSRYPDITIRERKFLPYHSEHLNWLVMRWQLRSVKLLIRITLRYMTVGAKWTSANTIGNPMIIAISVSDSIMLSHERNITESNFSTTSRASYVH